MRRLRRAGRRLRDGYGALPIDRGSSVAGFDGPACIPASPNPRGLFAGAKTGMPIAGARRCAWSRPGSGLPASRHLPGHPGPTRLRLSNDEVRWLVGVWIAVSTHGITWLGSSGALLRRPLRTGRASHPASGSSHSSAPWGGTEQFDGTLRSATTSQVLGPPRVEGMRSPGHLDMAGDRHGRRAEDLQSDGCAVSCALRCESPRPCHSLPEVPSDDPPRSFGGVPAHGPPPEHSPDVCVDE